MKMLTCHILFFSLVMCFTLAEVNITEIKLWGTLPHIEIKANFSELANNITVVIYSSRNNHTQYIEETKKQSDIVLSLQINHTLIHLGGVAVFNGSFSNITDLDSTKLLSSAVYCFNCSSQLDQVATNLSHALNITVNYFNNTPVATEFLSWQNGSYYLTDSTDFENHASSVIPTTVQPATGYGSSNTSVPTTQSASKTATAATISITSAVSPTSTAVLGTTSSNLTTTNSSSIPPDTTNTHSTTGNSTAATSTTVSSALVSTSSAPKVNRSSTKHPASTSSAASSESTSPSTSTSSTSQTSSSSSTAMTTPTVRPQKQVMINEVSLIVAEKGHFVELKGLQQGGYPDLSLVLFDGVENKCLHDIKINNSVSSQMSEFEIFPIPDNVPVNTTAFVIALFDKTKWETSITCKKGLNLNMSGLLDVLVVAKSYEQISSQALNTFVGNRRTHPFILNPEKITGRNYTINRCAEWLKNSSAFYLSPPSKQNKNLCSTGHGNKIQLKLIDANCKDFKTQSARNELRDTLVFKVADSCQCGISTMLFKLPKYHCGSLIFEAFLEASDANLANKMFTFYNDFIKKTPHLTINSKMYQVDTNCKNQCLNTSPAKHDGNIKETIAVVMSCLAVFLIIVVVVIIYLRKKRRGVLQFRMTRLDEEDDDLVNPEMDDFVGSSQGASFENKLYNRFTS